MEKTVKFLQDYLSSYMATIINTMLHPVGRFRFNPDAGHKSRQTVSLNPHLWSFSVASILIATVIFSVAVGELDVPALTETLLAFVLIVIWFWILFGVYAHLLCRGCHGKAKFTETLAITLQILSVVYVVSSFVAFTINLFIKAFVSHGHFDVSILYMISQFILLSIYLPPSLRGAHDLTLKHQIILTIALPAAVIVTNGFLFFLVAINLFPIQIHK